MLTKYSSPHPSGRIADRVPTARLAWCFPSTLLSRVQTITQPSRQTRCQAEAPPQPHQGQDLQVVPLLHRRRSMLESCSRWLLLLWACCDDCFHSWRVFVMLDDTDELSRDFTLRTIRAVFIYHRLYDFHCINVPAFVCSLPCRAEYFPALIMLSNNRPKVPNQAPTRTCRSPCKQ